ncbi:MAG: transposase IS30 [Gallionellaceae bacterium]|nr:MAG: transposase IS30 [Gallionellaceae bacterium]
MIGESAHNYFDFQAEGEYHSRIESLIRPRAASRTGKLVTLPMQRKSKIVAVISRGHLPGRKLAPLSTADSTRRCNTLNFAKAKGVLQIKRRSCIHYTEIQKALMWDRWQKGDSLQQIVQLFDRYHSSIERI